jgi:transcriptional regulator of acetoin/glycerol metabolism
VSDTRDITSTTVSRDDGDGDEAAPQAVGPVLLLLLECDRPLASSSRHLLADLDQVTLGRGDARRAARTGRTLALEVPDARMSQAHARMVRAGNRWAIEDAGSKNGVILQSARHERVTLDDGDVFELGHTFFLFCDPPRAAQVRSLIPLPADCDASALQPAAPGLDSFAPALLRSTRELAQVATTPVSILIQGETGTGKELLARAARVLAGRSGPFVAVNCGALPETLVESELFGYRKGAFSGAAQDRAGLVRSAERGTLFLDEIGDLSPPSQAALLRVLQEREVTPLGASQPIPVDVQLVAATHHDLHEMIGRDKFRRDLYGRIAGFTVRLPALRNRREDLGLLIASLLRRVVPADVVAEVRFHIEAFRALLAHDWPLNVRELEACLGIAAALAGHGLIRTEHLPESVRGGGEEQETGEPPPAPLSAEDAARRDELIELLREHHGNISAVARAAGKARVQIHRWLKRYRLDPERFRR